MVAVAQAIRALDQTVRIQIETYARTAQKCTVKKSRSCRQNRRRIRHVPVRQEDSTATGWPILKSGKREFLPVLVGVICPKCGAEVRLDSDELSQTSAVLRKF